MHYKWSLFIAHFVCTGIIYFVLSSVGSYSRAMNYCLTLSSSSHWLAYRKKIRLQLASFFNLSTTGIMFRLCPTPNSEASFNDQKARKKETATVKSCSTSLIPEGTLCVLRASRRSEVRVSSRTACRDSVCWSKTPLQAGCLLTQLLRSSLKDTLCKHTEWRKTRLAHWH